MRARTRTNVTSGPRRGLAAAGIGALAFGLIGAALPAALAAPASAVTTAGAATATDAFGRTTTSGWGTAPTGGAWTTTGGVASDYTVSNGVASMLVRQAGWQLNSSLLTNKTTDSELQVRVGVDKLVTGGNLDVNVTGRAIDGTQGYRLRLKVQPSGDLRVALVAASGKTATVLKETTIPAVKYTGTDQLQVRFQVKGTKPTTLNAKVWQVGKAEPSSWLLTTTDSNAALQVAGGTALGAYTASSMTSVPITARFADVWAGPTASARTLTTAPPAVGTYVPDAATTGVPAGTTLTKHAGDLILSTPGQVVDGLDISGFVKVTAPNVTIKNSIIRGKATTKQTALLTSATTGASVTIQDSELFAATPSPWIDGMRGYGITAKRVEIRDVIDSAHLYGDNVTIEASWLHSNVHYQVDPAQNNTPSHDDSIQIQKGNNIRIVGNNISGAFNTGVQFTQDQGIVSNVTIDKNKLDGGGCTINLAEKGKGPFQGVKITNNTFGRTTKIANCAIISPTTTVLTTSNNFFVDGATAYVRKG